MEPIANVSPRRKSEGGVRALAKLSRIIPQAPPPVESTAPPSNHDDTVTLWARALLARSYYLVPKLSSITNVAELADLVEDLLDDGEWFRLTNRVRDLTSAEAAINTLIHAQSSSPPQYFLGLAGNNAEIARKIQLAHRLETASVVAVLQFLTYYVSRPEGPRLDDWEAPDSPVWFLADSSIPLEYKEILLDRAKADISLDALLALYFARETKRFIAPRWMIESLVDRWITGARGQLTLLATAPGVDRLERSLVDPIQLKMLQGAYSLEDVAERGYQERLKAARGSSGWYPEPANDDD